MAKLGDISTESLIKKCEMVIEVRPKYPRFLDLRWRIGALLLKSGAYIMGYAKGRIEVP